MSNLRALLVLVSAALCAVAGGVVGIGQAEARTFHPALEVFLADGATPADDTTLHPGDRLVVKGTGFDPNSNTSGLPMPVPPGVPHGTFIAFGAFAPHWQPSEGAPESSRAMVRSSAKWAISRKSLDKVPAAPFDLRRTIRQQWVPLDRSGDFTAEMTLKTPEEIPANARWGVYTYGAAGSSNAKQELSVPVDYSTADGPNTPHPAPKNLIWGYSPSLTPAIENTQGALSGSGGAAADEKTDRLSFALTANTIRDGHGELRYQGTVAASTRFHLLDFAMADPIIRVDGTKAVLSMRTSSTDTNGDDALRRVDIADLSPTEAQVARLDRGEKVAGIPAKFRQRVTPTSLAALSLGPASPVTVDF